MTAARGDGRLLLPEAPPSHSMLSRLAARLAAPKNPLYLLRERLRGQGAEIRDLVSGNVHEHGLAFPEDVLESILVEAGRLARTYAPDSLGRSEARDAIAAYYARRNCPIAPEGIVLTPGTSLSYWYCFKLLADPGDEILCPRPSYPLFDYIASLSGVRLVSYPLREASRWELDLDRLEATISTRTRAIVLISPHNPTGHTATEAEVAGLAEIATRHGLPVISDEVFSEFLMAGSHPARPAATQAPLVLTLNGFSKMFALPGWKVGWIGVSGEKSRVDEALAALELISDTFLPVNEVAQAAVPFVFERGAPFLARYVEEIRKRARVAEAVLRRSTRLGLQSPEGGFYVTVRLADGLDESEASMELLRRERLLVHPGHFYEMTPDHLVLSFVSEPEALEEALERLVEGLDRL